MTTSKPQMTDAGQVVSHSSTSLKSLDPSAAGECGTLLLATLAAVALTVARRESSNDSAWLYGTALTWLGSPWVMWSAGRWHRSLVPRLAKFQAAFVTAWIALPWVVAWLARLAGVGEAFEISLLTSLQNAALMLGAISDQRKWRHTSCLLSSFAMLFAVSISDQRGVGVLAAAYGALALWWLMARYWERLHAARTAVRFERCWRLRGTVIFATLSVLAVLGATLGTAAKSTHVLRGFLPTSGGHQGSDPNARSGVGDGDAMVAAQDKAMSFGPVESELFLEDTMPSLYDMLSDQYGDPPKPKTQQERSIALAQLDIGESERRFAKTERNGREFSALRNTPRQRPTQLGDRVAPAMLYVVGPVPLHLALETYDHFDGSTWSHALPPTTMPSLRLEHLGPKPWLRLRSPPADGQFREPIRHALKIINLDTARIPTPPNLTALHIDQLDQPDFFAWTPDGVLYMDDRERIPQLTVLHLASHAINLDRWRDERHTPGERVAPTTRDTPPVDASAERNSRQQASQQASLAAYCQLPEPAVAHASVARQWCEGVPRGWRQVEAVVDRLRRDFTLDPAARAPTDCPDVVAHFLRAGRGPDYLFASTAAVMLRSLEYPTRLVTGFYARPDRFDRRAGQTAVLSDDVHVWAEVSLDGRTWVTIEPTPGYAPPQESRTWREWLARAGQFIALAARRHWLAGLALLACVCGLCVARHWWLDWLLSAACRLALIGGSWERRVRGTIRLLEWRAWLAGRRRPASRTLGRWYGRALGDATDVQRQAFAGFLALADAALYRPPGATRQTNSAGDMNVTKDAARVCRVVESWFTVRRLVRHDFSKAES